MNRMSDTTWALDVEVPAGMRQFKFVINDQWCTSPMYDTVDDGHSGFNNTREVINISDKMEDKSQEDSQEDSLEDSQEDLEEDIPDDLGKSSNPASDDKRDPSQEPGENPTCCII